MAEHQHIEMQSVPVVIKTYTYSPREQWTHHICSAIALLGTIYVSFDAFDVLKNAHDGKVLDLIPGLLFPLGMAALLNQCYPKPSELTK